MSKISGEFDDGDDEYGADYDTNDVDTEHEPEISNDNDQDYDPENTTESEEDCDPFKCPDYNNSDPEYDPFKCPDYNNSDPDYDPFKCPDYNNPDPEYDPFICPDYDNEGDKCPSNVALEMDNNPENEPDEPIKEYELEGEPEKQPEGLNNPSNSGTVTIVKPEQEKQGNEQEQEEKPEIFELITPEGEPERPGEPPEVMKLRADLEEWGYPCEPDEDYAPPELKQDSEDEPEIELDTETKQGHEYEADLEPEKEFNKIPEQEEKELPIDDKEIKNEEEIQQESNIKEEIKNQEAQEVLKESLEESNLEKQQELKEIIKDTEKEDYEILKEQYHQETEKRAIYAKKETKGFIEWKARKEENEYQELEEKYELDQELKKEIQECKEESVKFLINSIREAYSKKEISENTKDDLTELLKEYDKVYELFKKFQNQEIDKQEFEQEREKIEKELGERLKIGRLLFKDFDEFRRDYNELERRAGKRVAMLQISHKTNRILIDISRRLEQNKREGISQDSLEMDSISQEWATFLKYHIKEIADQEISKEIKEELQYLITQFTNNNKLLINQLKKKNPRFDDFFKELKSSLAIYKEYKNSWYEKSLIPEGKRKAKKIANQLSELKKDYILKLFFDKINPEFQNLKELLNQNLYKSIELKMNEKSKIFKIIKKENSTEEDQRELLSILDKLPSKELNLLLGKDFKNFYINLVSLRDTIELEIKNPIFIYGESFKFSEDFRLKLCEYIYNLITNEDLNNQKNSQKANIDFEDVLKKIINNLKIIGCYKRFPINKEGFDKFLEKYIRDLVIIVSEFKTREKSSDLKPLNISQLADKLLSQGNNLNNKKPQLRANLRRIFLYLKKNIDNFNLTKINKQFLENDEKGKVCGRCGLKKPYHEFFKREKGLIKYTCKSCYSEMTEISKFKKKFRLLLELQNGNFKGVCSNPDCKIDFKWLPAMEFHHLSKKTAAWRDILKKKYEKIKEILDEKDRAKPLCRNCHSLINKIFYNKYKEIINDNSIFVNSNGEVYPIDQIVKEIEKRIKKIKLIDGYKLSKTKYNVFAWIKKRLVIEQLYNGKCVICEEHNVAKLQFHHLDPSLKNTFKHKNKNLDKLSIWKTFVLSNISETIERLIFEECMCVCSNCHSMIESKIFEKNATEILSEKYYLEENEQIREHQLNAKKYVKEIEEIFKKIREALLKEHDRIKLIKINNNFKITDPLIMYKIWEEILLYAYHLIKFKEKNEFTVKELQNLTGFNIDKLKRWLKYLEGNNLIDINHIGSRNARIYELNIKGKEVTNKIIKKYKKYYESGYNAFKKKIRSEL